MVLFTWLGLDEMDEVAGDGSAELLDDDHSRSGSPTHHGDGAILKATA
jgi:hypothetical protein